MNLSFLLAVRMLIVALLLSTVILNPCEGHQNQHQRQQQAAPEPPAISLSLKDLELARVSCNAGYSLPCSRTIAQYLAVVVATKLTRGTGNNNNNLYNVDSIARFPDIAKFNEPTGFYPFILRKDASGLCVGHGANSSLVGLTIEQIFDTQQLSYSNAADLHQRLVAAADRGGDWVEYLWNDQGAVNSKLAYIVPLGNNFLVGVGYENKPYPQDLPSSARFDSWSSITNVRSLVGAAQFRLAQAVSLARFELGLYALSNDPEYQILPEDAGDDKNKNNNDAFYTFVYGYDDGRLKAHPFHHDYIGKTLSEIIVGKNISSGTTQEGEELHRKFRLAADGKDSGWVQYEWRNDEDEQTYTKIAFLVKVEFQGDFYYLGAGFQFLMDTTALGPVGAQCSADYNYACAFRNALQLTSHTLSHIVSSPLPREQIFQTITDSNDFETGRDGSFYMFLYDLYNGTCVAHGAVPSYVGDTLAGIYQRSNITADATALHIQFGQAARQGGGWVLYDWIDPESKTIFKKISYVFRVTIDGRDYYGGVGFNDAQAPLEPYLDGGERTTMDGERIPCTAEYRFDCGESNALAVLGDTLAQVTLASSEAQRGVDDNLESDTLEMLYARINNGTTRGEKSNEFYTMVFSVDGCVGQDDGSGCCLANGSNESLVGLTWQQILDERRGADRNESFDGAAKGYKVHQELTLASNQMGGHYIYDDRIAWAARFRHDGKSYYVVSEISNTAPPTCEDGEGCPDWIGCNCTVTEPTSISEPSHNRIRAVLISSFACLFVGLVCYCCSRYWFRSKILEERAENDRLRQEQQQERLSQVFKITADFRPTSPEQYESSQGHTGYEQGDDGLEVALPPLPPEVSFVGETAENLLPVAEGQVVWVSKASDDSEWLFGFIMHPQDSEAENLLPERPRLGWFPRNIAEQATMQITFPPQPGMSPEEGDRPCLVVIFN